jgi:hypothetical protein
MAAQTVAGPRPARAGSRPPPYRRIAVKTSSFSFASV